MRPNGSRARSIRNSRAGGTASAAHGGPRSGAPAGCFTRGGDGPGPSRHRHCRQFTNRRLAGPRAGIRHDHGRGATAGVRSIRRGGSCRTRRPGLFARYPSLCGPARRGRAGRAAALHPPAGADLPQGGPHGRSADRFEQLRASTQPIGALPADLIGSSAQCRDLAAVAQLKQHDTGRGAAREGSHSQLAALLGAVPPVVGDRLAVGRER